MDGVLTDPSDVVITIEEPDGVLIERTLAAAQVIKISDGLFEYQHALTKEGNHHWRVQGTGAAAAAEEAVFQVRERRVPDATP